jgi:hypothetical protein
MEAVALSGLLGRMRAVLDSHACTKPAEALRACVQDTQSSTLDKKADCSRYVAALQYCEAAAQSTHNYPANTAGWM